MAETDPNFDSGTNTKLLEDALRRPKRYWTADGIPEIAIGAFWLLWAAIILLPMAAPQLAKAKSLISIFGVFLAPVFLDWAVKRWKERVTYPRTGYVQFRPPSATMRLTLASLAGAVAIGVVLAIRFGGFAIRNWIAATLGVVICLTLLFQAWCQRSLRLGVLCLAIAATGIAVDMAGVAHDDSIMFVFLAAGVVCVLDGLLRMRSYVREHPLPAGEPS